MSGQINRRELGKMALGSALGAAVAGLPEVSFASPAHAPVPPQPSGIHLSIYGPLHPTDEEILFYKQLGLDTVYCRGSKPEDQTVDGLKAMKKRWADAGINLSDIDNAGVALGLEKIVLNQPGRDEAIEAYKKWIRTLGEAGFEYVEAIMYNATASVVSGYAPTRGKTRGREFDQNSPELSGAPWKVPSRGAIDEPLLGRVYTKDEMWANFTYFIKAIVPVAEEAGVKLTFDNDDPPLPSIFGVPRLFSSFEDVKKAMQIANSPNVGFTFTTGQWIEGGPGMGIDVVGAAKYFASKKQIFEVFLRNPSGSLPRFHETFIDDGVFDMYKIIKALVDAKYDGIITLDHDMGMVGGRRTYEAFGIGYMRALVQCAQRGYHI